MLGLQLRVAVIGFCFPDKYLIVNTEWNQLVPNCDYGLLSLEVKKNRNIQHGTFGWLAGEIRASQMNLVLWVSDLGQQQ